MQKSDVTFVLGVILDAGQVKSVSFCWLMPESAAGP